MGLVQKSFSDIITFSRSSNATRVGPTGVLEYAPHNLLTYSEQFNDAAWTKTNTSVTANAIAAPDGTVTGETLSATATTNGHELINTFTASSGTTYTLSVYAKLGVSNFIQLVFGSGSFGVDVWANFNLSTGSLGTLGSLTAATITNVGNGWYRCTITGTATSSAGSAVVIVPINSATAARNPTFDGTGQSVFIWGAQLSVGPYALDYTPTTSAAVYGPRFDYDGSGVTIVEPVSRNLVTYSEDFSNAAWTKLNASVTANAATSPDGTVSADLLIPDTSSNQHGVYQSLGATAGTSYTQSVFAKAAGYNWLFMTEGNNVSAQASFNLATGVVGTVSGTGSPSATITALGNGWYRCTLTYTPIATSQNIQARAANADGGLTFAGNGTSGIYLWGAQLEVGSTATAYMVSGASNGFRAVPVVSGSATPKGLLVEESRTNLLTYSEDFSNAAWNKGSGFTLTANAIASPDGTVNADLFVRGTTSSFAYLSQITSGNASQATTFSCWVRTVSGTSSIRLVISDFVLTSLNSSALSINTTWQRLSFSIAAGQLANTGSIGVGFLMDAGQSAYFWGAQLEANASFASSYIPTLASTVTRSADTASVSALSPWFNNAQGTWFAEMDVLSIAASTYHAALEAWASGDSNARMFVDIDAGTAKGYIRQNTAGSGTFMSTGVSVSANSSVKIAMAFETNNNATSAGGSAVATSTTTTPTIDTVYLGRFGPAGASSPMCGHLSRIAFYPRRLTNAELQALTS